MPAWFCHWQFPHRRACSRNGAEEHACKRVQDSAVFNAIAKIYIDSNNDPEQFLKENNVIGFLKKSEFYVDVSICKLYEPLVIGRFCEACDPYLAYIAYAKGFCNDELISITNDNLMFRQQTCYLV